MGILQYTFVLLASMLAIHYDGAFAAGRQLQQMDIQTSNTLSSSTNFNTARGKKGRMNENRKGGKRARSFENNNQIESNMEFGKSGAGKTSTTETSTQTFDDGGDGMSGGDYGDSDSYYGSDSDESGSSNSYDSDNTYDSDDAAIQRAAGDGEDYTAADYVADEDLALADYAVDVGGPAASASSSASRSADASMDLLMAPDLHPIYNAIEGSIDNTAADTQEAFERATRQVSSWLAGPLAAASKQFTSNLQLSETVPDNSDNEQAGESTCGDIPFYEELRWMLPDFDSC